MFGVVLWSDQIRNRAVIWCEDHGDLAFFNGDASGSSKGTGMEPGDLVQFDVQEQRHMRLACNIRLMASDEYPTLANDLKEAHTDPRACPAPAPLRGGKRDGKIVVFEAKPANSPEVRPPIRRVV